MKFSHCRFCDAALRRKFVDLGRTPLANSFLTVDSAATMEPSYPLRAYVCEQCLLVQLEEYTSGEEIFKDYPYFSSYSQSWLRHCRDHVHTMIERHCLGESSLVIEVASNDGYLLQYFKERGIPVLGIEPAANVAEAAKLKGIPTHVAFFGVATATQLAREGKSADFMVANNVLAHVPDLNDFVAAFKVLLKPAGTATLEFPHLMRLIREHQFDTIYHEHLSYLSLLVVDKLFSRHGLKVFDVEQLTAHGGSLRIHVAHAQGGHPRTVEVDSLIGAEIAAGLDRPETYDSFAETVIDVKCNLLEFLIRARRANKLVVGYGAPAKGNTLLNYCGVGPELVRYTVDASPHKQGRFLPGVQIPIFAPQHIFETRPDYILILPWNLKNEITAQMAGIREWGGRFVVAIPGLTVLP